MRELRISSVESLGLRQVYDMYVPGDHSYTLSNGIINHNTNPDIRKCLKASPGRLYLMMDYSQCIEENSLVYTKQGLKKIKEVIPFEDKVCLKDPSHIHSSRSLNAGVVVNKGKAKCLKLTTNMGRELILTLDHPVKSIGGFTKAQELKLGDTLFIENIGKSKRMGHINIDPTEAYIAGVFYGDGHYPGTKSNTRDEHRSIFFSTGLDREELKPLLESFFKTNFPSPKLKTRGLRGFSDITKSFEEKYPKVSSYDMEIPSRILEATWESKMHFIGGQLDSDGHISKGSRFRYSSVCKKYIQQLLQLFNSVGLYPKITETYPKKGETCYHLICQSTEALKQVYPYVRLKRKKKAIKDNLKSKEKSLSPANQTSHCPSNRIPLEVYKGLPITEEFKKTYKNSLRKGRLIRSTLKVYLEDLIELDPRWAEVYGYRYEYVTNIEDAGIHTVYDMEVDKLHEFNPNGIRVHNCELRLMAHLSKCKGLLTAFANGWDPHLSVACNKYKVKYDDIEPIYKDELHPEYKTWKVRRKQAKHIVFGCIYCIGKAKLAEELSDPKTGLVVSPNEAQQFLDDFFKDFPEVKKFMNKQMKFMHKHGYVKTLFGRKRRCPEVFGGTQMQVVESEHASVNIPCLLPSSQALCKTKGWVNYEQLSLGDEILAFDSETGLTQWETVDRVNAYKFKGDMVRMHNKHIDIQSTPDHRWYVSPRSGSIPTQYNTYREQKRLVEEFNSRRDKIQELYNQGNNLHQVSIMMGIPYTKVRKIYYGRVKGPLFNPLSKPLEIKTSDELYTSNKVYSIPIRANHKNVNVNHMDSTFVSFLGWYLTDGSRKKGRVKLMQSITANPEKVKLIDGIMSNLGIPYDRKPHKSSDLIYWVIKDTTFVSKLDTLVPHRKLNMELLGILDNEQLQILHTNMRLGDGYKKFISGDKLQAELMQALTVLVGNTSRMDLQSKEGDISYFKDKKPSKSGQLYVQATKDSWGIKFSTKRDSVHTRNSYKPESNLTKVPYEGMVWCPTVKSGAFVVRAKGEDGSYRTLITGNCQGAASDMALFTSVLIDQKVTNGELPDLQEVGTVHDSIYFETLPQDINPRTVYELWSMAKNPETKKYFGFQIDDIDMAMDFEVGRSQGEELPFAPGYDYSRLLNFQGDWKGSKEEEKYFSYVNKYKHIPIKEYPKAFPRYFK